MLSSTYLPGGRRALPLLFLSVVLTGPCAWSQSVLTQRNDIARSGQNLSEITLNPANVNTTSFGRLFSVPVDGYVYAQPLYLPSLTIPGLGQHNVVFIATEHDSVYAFDADSNAGANAAPLWKASLLDAAHGAAPGATTEPSTNVNTPDIQPEIGITGTPVIDPLSGTIYLVGQTVENGASVQRLHALDVTTGAEKFGGPVALAASVPGTGVGNVGGLVSFDPKWQNNRAGLLLLNNIVYLAFGSHGDKDTWRGWLLAYDAGTLTLTGAFATTPNGAGSGIWMAGAGLAADVPDPVNFPFGRMFVATGNGAYSAAPPYTNRMNYGDDQLRLDLANGQPLVADAFTPFNQNQLYTQDKDLGSGGILLLPDQTSGGHTHLLVQAGKLGAIYLVDRDNMGGYNTVSDNIVQEINGQIGGIWSTPAYWNNSVYFWGSGDTLKSFALANGQLSTTPVSAAMEKSNYPGSSPVVSASGSTNGIVWNTQSDAYKTSGPAILYAHDAGNVANTLYSSKQNAIRDNPGGAVKFTVPTVINGKVYVGAQYQFSVYGLLNGMQQAALPVLSPGAESFGGSLAVSITDATPGAAIYYTTDGSAPTEASNLYSGPVTITATATLRALASAPGYLQSNYASQTYTLLQPTFGLASSSGNVNVVPGSTGSVTVTVTPQNGFSANVNLSAVNLPSGVTASFNPASTATTSVLTFSVASSAAAGVYSVLLSGTGGGQSQSASLTLTIGASNALQFVPASPCRVLDTRGAAGPFGGPSLAAGVTRSFVLSNSSCNIPASALAFSLNVTVVPAKTLQYLTVWPQGQPQPNVSTLNSNDGRIKANAAIVPAGAGGAISAYASDATQLIIDIDGYFVSAGSSASAMAYYNQTPCRLVDTRTAAGALGGPYMPAKSTRVFPLLSSACNVPAAAVAYSLNYTVVPRRTLSYLTTWPAGQSQPNISTLNAPTGTVTANAAIVPAGSNGAVAVYVTDDTDLLIDVNGYFAPPAAGGLSLYPVTPCRSIDTRSGSGAFNGALAVPVATGTCQVNSAAQAYVFNATVVPAAVLAYLTLWPNGLSQPAVSTLNAYDKAVTSNMAIVPTANGIVSAFSSNATQLILDISSYFAP